MSGNLLLGNSLPAAATRTSALQKLTLLLILDRNNIPLGVYFTTVRWVIILLVIWVDKNEVERSRGWINSGSCQGK